MARAVAGVNDDGQVRFSLDHRNAAQIQRVPGGRFECSDSALAKYDVGIAFRENVFGRHEELFDRRHHSTLE